MAFFLQVMGAVPLDFYRLAATLGERETEKWGEG